MKCKSCKRDIPDESIFCLHCGEKVVRTRSKSDIKIPKPRYFPRTGKWYGQIMDEGVRYPIEASSKEEYYAKGQAFKLGLIESKKKGKEKNSLRSLVKSYVDSVSATLSPATIRGYRTIEKHRFAKWMDKAADTVDYQRMINDEVKSGASPKTVKNAWGLITASLRAAGISVPAVKLPMVPGSDEDFLDYKEIKKFLSAIEGHKVEAAALLALHGLRMSEILDLDVAQITPDGISIRGATVPDENNKLVHKSTNKTVNSRRDVPIIIPRLLEVLPPDGKAVTLHPSSVRRYLESVCAQADVTVCSPHDLRRSFTSLAFHLGWDAETTRQLGGWANLDVINKVYRKLADADRKRDVRKMRKFYEK